jgi:tetratricopeptide (TPR) repeat protein
LNILHLLGLFDRPAIAGALDSLKAPPSIPGLTSELHNLSLVDWQEALANLRDARLLAPADPDQPDTLDCHPLIREYFGNKLKNENPEAWREAHSRLYEYYKTQAPELPDTLEAMLPLYSAVAHGCQADRHQEALDQVYRYRMVRGLDFFSTMKLGAYGADLAVLANFFDPAWVRTFPKLREESRGFVLNGASFCLMTLGRLSEAVQPLKAAMDIAISQKMWVNAVRVAGNLCDLFLLLGRFDQARNYIIHAKEIANRSNSPIVNITYQVYLALLLFQEGQLIKAEKIFQQAENLQQQFQPEFSLLYSMQGFKYCELLISLGRYREVLRRAEKTLEWAIKSRNIKDIAQDHHSLGKAFLNQSLAEKGYEFTQAKDHLDHAMAGLRQAGGEDDLIQFLLSRAELYRVQKDWDHANQDLQEAMARAKRSSMAPLQTDAYLEYARLYLAQGKPQKARSHLDITKRMIAEIGYGRRRQDVLDLEAQLRRTH